MRIVERNQADATMVGIFWGVPDGHGTRVLVTDGTALATAEPYGDALTHLQGHYEVWEAWQRLGAAGLVRRSLPAAIAFAEYEEFPRGRIVFDTKSETFVIYADRELQTVPIIERIVQAFGLTGQRIIVCSDAHYRT